MTTSSKLAVIVALAGALTVLPAIASAQTVPPTQSADTVCQEQAGTATTSAERIAQIIAEGNCEINVRDVALNAGITRVSQMQKVSSSTQASLTQTLQSTISTLATIQASLDADTSTTTAVADQKSIFGSVRVFALVLPRTWVYASSDRAMTITSDIQVVDNELIAKNAAASTTVQNENAPYLADIAYQIGQANTLATNADSTVQPLVPDLGVTSVLASNTASLQSAEAMLKTAEADIQAAVGDIKQVRTNLKV
jgi:hypothetical protein